MKPLAHRDMHSMAQFLTGNPTSQLIPSTPYGANDLSYDSDILAISETDVERAKQSLAIFLRNRKAYENFSEEYLWTHPKTDEVFHVVILTPKLIGTLGLEENVEDDPRTIGWISFNYFRSEDYYDAVANELDAILASGPVEFYDPQFDRAWVGKIDREAIFGE